MPRGEIIDNWVGQRVKIKSYGYISQRDAEAHGRRPFTAELLGICAKGVTFRRGAGDPMFWPWGRVEVITKLNEDLEL